MAEEPVRTVQETVNVKTYKPVVDMMVEAAMLTVRCRRPRRSSRLHSPCAGLSTTLTATASSPLRNGSGMQMTVTMYSPLCVPLQRQERSRSVSDRMGPCCQPCLARCPEPLHAQ